MVLRKLGVSERMISAIMTFHQMMRDSVGSGVEVSDPSIVSNGTKQGYILEPLLFALNVFS